MSTGESTGLLLSHALVLSMMAVTFIRRANGQGDSQLGDMHNSSQVLENPCCSLDASVSCGLWVD